MQLFVRVVETGSFSRAAEHLGTTQPTATKAVADAERRLGARLLHRTTRGVSPTEVGTLYYERCKRIVREIEDAENLASLRQGQVGGTLRISTSVAFGRRIVVPKVLRYMREHPQLVVDLSFDDRYVNLVEQGIDVAIRMGRLADSTLGASFLGVNPWRLVGAPQYLAQRGTPRVPADLEAHDCLVYSSVQGDDRWPFSGPAGAALPVAVRGPLRSNNLSAVLAACRAAMGLAILPCYVLRESVADGSVVELMSEHALPSQQVHAVYPSPKLVPGKVTSFVEWLQRELHGSWWARAP